MTTKRFLKQCVVPVLVLAVITYLGQYIFMVDGELDWFRVCLVYGIPFGIPYMLSVIPIGGSITTSVAILVLNIIIGAMLGCVIAAVALGKAVIIGIWFMLSVGKRVLVR